MAIRKIVKTLLVLALIFVVGGIGGIYIDRQILPLIRTSRFLSKIDFLKKTAENVTIINRTEQLVVQEDDSINEVAGRASTAVVNIISKKKEAREGRIASKEELADSISGTGVIVTSDGMIVTYRKAIMEDGADYKVFAADGSSYDAQLVGIDPFTNLAFLKISASNLTDMPLAESGEFKPGRKVIAIGNSFGEYQNRYSAGLLSNIDKTLNLAGKTVSSADKLEGVFETDFDNQKEYLGGPIISFRGEMIGLIGMETMDNKDVFFQVPSDEIKKSIDRAIKGELETVPQFGAYYVSITKEYAFAHDLAQDRGALIFSPSGKQGLAVMSGSPAEKAGILVGDVIISVGTKGVNLDNPLSNLLAEYKKGDSVELTLIRNGQEMKIKANL